MKKIISMLMVIAMCLSFTTVSFAAEMNFTDVQSSDWFYNDVKNAVELGLVNGKSETSYAPSDNLTYAEAIKLAACMNMLYEQGEISLTAGNPWYMPFVDYCVEYGIIDKEYDYSANATRAGYMGIFANALPEEGFAAINNVPDNSIPDVPSSRAYAPAVYKLYRAGILTGVDAEHNCNPLANITRAEVAAILTRMMDETKRVEITDMGNAEEQKPEEQKPEEQKPEEKEPEVKEPEVKEPEEKEPEVKEPEVKEPETTGTSSGGVKDKFQQVDAEEPKKEDFAMTIDGVYNVADRGIVLTGYVSAGKVNVGDTVYLNDADGKYVATTTIKAIEMFSKLLDECEKGDKPGINVDLDVDTYKSMKLGGYELSATKGSSSLGTRPSVSRPSTVTRPTTTRRDLSITSQSEDVSGSVGLFKLAVEVEGGTTPYTYQWKKLTTITSRGRKTLQYVNLEDADGTIKGAQTANLTLSLTTLNTYKYKCVITDADGNSVTSEEITVTVDSESTGGRVAIPTGGKSEY